MSRGAEVVYAIAEAVSIGGSFNTMTAGKLLVLASELRN